MEIFEADFGNVEIVNKLLDFIDLVSSFVYNFTKMLMRICFSLVAINRELYIWHV